MSVPNRSAITPTYFDPTRGETIRSEFRGLLIVDLPDGRIALRHPIPRELSFDPVFAAQLERATRAAERAKTRRRLSRFFRLLWDGLHGFTCVFIGLGPHISERGTLQHTKVIEKWIEVKRDIDTLTALVTDPEVVPAADIYFTPMLFSGPSRRRADNLALGGHTLWADLDNGLMEGAPPPAALVASGSPGHLQAYWRFGRMAAPPVIESANKDLAYRLDGDRSGWDREQLLRVPFTINHKHGRPVALRQVFAMWPSVIAKNSELSSWFATQPRRPNKREDITPVADTDVGAMWATAAAESSDDHKFALLQGRWAGTIKPWQDRDRALVEARHWAREAGLSNEITYLILRTSASFRSKFGIRSADEQHRRLQELIALEPGSAPTSSRSRNP